MAWLCNADKNVMLRSRVADGKNEKSTNLSKKQVKLRLQRPAARYDGIGKIGGGHGFLVSMVSRAVSRCPWLPKFVPCYLKWSLVA